MDSEIIKKKLKQQQFHWSLYENHSYDLVEWENLFKKTERKLRELKILK